MLAELGEAGYWFRKVQDSDADAPLKGERVLAQASQARILAVFRPRRFGGSLIRAAYGVELEQWSSESVSGLEMMVAPRENRASARLSMEDFELTGMQWCGRSVLTPKALTRRMIDDPPGPIDAVYTWVDGSDPAWLERRARADADESGSVYHPEAVMSARFEDHQELRFSLRSIAYYAPWVRNIYIVTDGQVPQWLNTAHPKIHIVDHAEVFPAGSQLPNFNSNAIISCLHRIPGLAEHYIYFNDDVFLGRWVGPEKFFNGAGLARLSPANNHRPFASPRVEDEPHLNLTRNIRTLLESRFGVTVARAIKHTPHPQIKSLHTEIEHAFPEAYELTRSHRFRHHLDIVADQMHHYYAQIVGKAFDAPLRYEYVNIQDVAHRGRLDALLRKRDRDAFCLNDTPLSEREPLAPSEVSGFLEAYFPVPSQFERD